MIKSVFYVFGIALLVMSCLGHRSTRNSVSDPLIDTSWEFVGYVSQIKDSIYKYPDDYNFTIRFEKKFKISGKAFENYSGTYKYKKDQLLLTPYIHVGYNSKLDTVTYGSREAYHHLMLYEHSLSMSNPVKVEISGNEMLIYATRVMKFVKTDQ